MADRRSDETPLAPRRSLRASVPEAEDQPTVAQRRVAAPEAPAIRDSGSAPEPMPAREPGAVPQPADGTGRRDGMVRSAQPGRPEGGTAGGATSSRRPVTAERPAPRTRKARLRLVHLDPWSVMKTAFLLSIAIGIVTVVAVAVVWSVLDAAGVWTSINKTVSDVLGGDSATTFDVRNYVGTSRVMGFTMIVAVVDVVLITAISTLAAFIYNLAAALLGGLEVTLAEDQR
jgi:hypothetical protein